MLSLPYTDSFAASTCGAFTSAQGIHRRWDAGFRITACAATPDQSAFVISVPRRRPMDETQETLRTSAFPSSHVKEKWAKNLYIAGIAYGRTVS